MLDLTGKKRKGGKKKREGESTEDKDLPGISVCGEKKEK